ncbi:MAG TPA: Ig-like domain-containing protein [Fibrobacteria bacterium]|nr:Ig-like domain-containing protein [Fibrobacteria bacterium]
MKHRRAQGFLLALISFSALLILAACTATDDSEHTLNMIINKDNDSLLTFDSLIVKVYSQDSSFSQELFHGVLRNPKQVASLPMDPRVGREYIVFLIGYKNGKVGVKKEFAVHGPGNYQSKDLLAQAGKDTVTIDPTPPEILAPSDTSIAEGDSLRFRVTVRTPWSGPTTLTLKDPLSGAALDTVGRAPGEGEFTWRPNFDQGRSEPYVVTFVYSASADKKVEKSTRVKVLNVNRPPVFKLVQNQVVKEGEPLEFKVEATDPDLDSVALTLDSLPAGAHFTAGQFTWKPAPGQSGNYFLTFRASDGKAQDTLRLTITVGNVLPPPGKPVVKGKSPTNNKMPTWTWSSGGGGTGVFRYRLDNDDLSVSVPISDTSYIPPKELSEGTYTLYVQEKNSDGVWSLSGRLSIVIDATPPGAPAVSVPAAFTNNPKPTWTWVPGNGNGSRSYRYKLDDGDLMTGTTSTPIPKFTPATALPEGPHTLYVQEQDSAGNWSATGTASVTVDLTPPGVPKVSLGQPSPTNLPKPVWTWVGGGNAGMGLFRSKLDDSILTSGAAPGTLLSFTPDAALKEGKHTLYVQERDSAGNWSATGTASVTVDLTPPGAPVFDATPLSPLNSLKPVWTWKSGGKGGVGTYRCKVDEANLASGATEVGNEQYAPPGNLSEAPHTLYVQERDSAGNWSFTSSKSLVLALQGIVGNAGFSAGNISDLSLVLSSTGVPYVAFQDEVNGGKATVMRLNPTGTAWEYVGKAGFSTGEARYTSLALSSAGVPYVAFRDGDNGDKATVMRLNTAGTAWEYVGNPGFSMDMVYFTSLALNNTGVPYIAFQDGSNYQEATVMRLNAAGTAWENVGNPGFSAGIAFPSLALSSTGVPYVAFSDGNNEHKAMVMRLNDAGTAWENVGNPGFSANGASTPSLALSSTGVPYVAFRDYGNGYKATAMRLNAAGTTWENVGNPGFSSGMAGPPSLALSSTGVPYVAFEDNSKGDKATVMRLNAAGTAWEYVGKIGFSAGMVDSPSLALSNTGVPYVAFRDYGNGEKATVMKTSFDP